MSSITNYTIKNRRGIDDLECEYAFRGNSQGDDSVSNEISDYLGSDSWMSFGFKNIDKTDQEAIYKESARIKAKNLAYIKELKESGKYGEEYDITISLVNDPFWDTPTKVTGKQLNDVTWSHKMVWLDTSKYNI